MAIRVDDNREQGGVRAMDARAANDRIADKAEALRFLSRVPMLCECSAPDCRKVLMVGLEDYRTLRRDPDNILTAPGHDAEHTELREEAAGYEIRRPVHTRGNGNGDRRCA